MKTIKIFMIVILVCLPVLLLAETDYFKRIKQVKAAHPDWPSNVCESVAMGKVTEGMTQEQVIASWGRPVKIFDKIGDKGRYDYWHYKEVVVRFKDKKVEKIQIKERR